MNYGMIGNCKTAALVSEFGSIEWCCMPNFSSPFIFGALLDLEGGKFEINLETANQGSQSYIASTNILQTQFDDGQNAFMLIDFMPRYKEGSIYKRPLEIHRLLRPLKGAPKVRIKFLPKLNYARGETILQWGNGVIRAFNDLEDIYLYSNVPTQLIRDDQTFKLTKDCFFTLSYNEKIQPPNLELVEELFEKTKTYWEGWTSHCKLPRLYSKEVIRSALALKLMTFEDSGAIVAAPTTSLPEISGKDRNWDYRFCWLRDSSLMLEALKSIGHFEEARDYIHFLLWVFESKLTKPQILYGINGETDLEEIILPHLKGYQNSQPVRIGNQAALMQQNDVYGEMLDTIYLYFVHYKFEKMGDDIWSLVKFLVSMAARVWKQEDAGIWEFRNQKSHFTYSKALCWVAIDRGIKIARHLGKTNLIEQWEPIADEIRNDIEAHGWNNQLATYTQAYSSENLDASVLLMNWYGYIDASNPKWQSTVRRCALELVENGYGFRYRAADDFGMPETSFVVASIWIAMALVTIGEREQAITLFENILKRANPLGLLSEDINPYTGELLGNFPQAYSHMAIINMAMLLNK